jgi:hypothetical protein
VPLVLLNADGFLPIFQAAMVISEQEQEVILVLMICVASAFQSRARLLEKQLAMSSPTLIARRVLVLNKLTMSVIRNTGQLCVATV